MEKAYPHSATTQQSSSRHIASNALVLFVRMLILTLIGLYSVRIVLRGLGEVDYGIFNTVVGVITTSSLISSVLALSVQRFFSFYLGKQETGILRDIFSASTNISIVMVLAVFVIFEAVGLWFVSNHLTIPPERLSASLQAFQFALLSFTMSLIQIPYTAAIFAHEDMGIYAAISTVECLLKLGAAFLMSRSSSDHLAFYSFLLLLVSIAVLCCYVTMARKRYPECRYQKVKTRRLHHDLLYFSSWTFLGTAANVGIIQGNTILLNIFFGPVTNAAFAIALQINNAFSSLYNCIILALRPPMIKSYADNNYRYLDRLFYIGNKMLFFILISIGIPLIFEAETILKFWLDEQVSSSTILFSRLIIIYIICMALNLPITTIVQATGKLKDYHLPVEGITLMCFPVTLLLFLAGCPSWGVFVSIIGITLVAHVVRLFCLRRCYVSFSIRYYVKSFCLPAIFIGLLALTLAFFIHLVLSTQSLLRIGAITTAIPLFVIVLVYAMGISKEERDIIRQLILSRLNKKKCSR